MATAPTNTKPFNVLPQYYQAPENSIVRKMFAVLPLIGPFFIVYNERKLALKINREEDSQANSSEKTYALIDIKNQYKIASIVSKLLVIATVAALIATGIFSGPVSLALGSISIGFGTIGIGIDMYHIRHNKQMQQHLANPTSDVKITIK